MSRPEVIQFAANEPTGAVCLLSHWLPQLLQFAIAWPFNLMSSPQGYAVWVPFDRLERSRLKAALVDANDSRAMKSIAERIAEELNVKGGQVAAAIALLDGGSTVPFVARYRKRRRGRSTTRSCARSRPGSRIFASSTTDAGRSSSSIREQGKLDDALEAQINEAETKARLEDIYLPFKPKRRTKAQIARENGLEPLAEALLAHPEREPLAQAEAYVKPDAVKTAQEALDGGRAILVERFAEDAELIGRLREDFWRAGGSSRKCAKARRPRERSSPTISTSSSRLSKSRRIGRSR